MMHTLQKYNFKDILLTLVFSVCAVALLFGNRIVILSNLLFGITAVALLLHAAFYQKKKFSKPSLLVILWATVYLVRVLWLIGDAHAACGVSWLDTCLPFLLYPMTVQWLQPDQQIIKNVLLVFFYACLLFCLISLGFTAVAIGTEPVTFADWLAAPKHFYLHTFSWTSYNHPSFLSVVYLFALPAGYYLKRQYNNIPLLLLVLAFIVAAVLVYMTGARIGQILFVLLLAFIIIDLFPRNKRLLIGGVALLLLAAGTLFIKLKHDDFADRFQDPVREQLIATTLHSIKENLFLGTGTGGMKAALNDSLTTQQLGYAAPLGFSYPHIQYIGEIMHFGILGALALFAALGHLCCTAFRRKNFLLQSLLLILFVFMCTEQPFDSNKGINFALFFFSLLYYENYGNRHHVE